jgi:ribose transport system permease protein
MSAAGQTVGGRRTWQGWSHRLAAQRGVMIAIAIFAAMFAVYGWQQEVGLTASIINTAANKGALLALVAMAQTIPVLTGGLDLSVGMVFMLTNCLAATIVVGDPLMTALGILGVLATGMACGALNGLIVVYGRLQPIIVTLATGAIYFGVALALRPEPGGSVNFELADLMTRSFYKVPSTVILLSSVVPPTPSAPPSRPPTCRACRSPRRRSSPMCLPGCSRPSPACSSPSSPIRVRPRRRSAPTTR